MRVELVAAGGERAVAGQVVRLVGVKRGDHNRGFDQRAALGGSRRVHRCLCGRACALRSARAAAVALKGLPVGPSTRRRLALTFMIPGRVTPDHERH